jgi:hypothetical protein
MNISNFELNTVLAALRHYQSLIDGISDQDLNEITRSSEHFYDSQLLDADQIDALCEKLNTDSSDPSVMLVDETGIPASFSCTSLFVNRQPVIQADMATDIPIEEIAHDLADALGIEVEQHAISEKQMALYMANKHGASSQEIKSIQKGQTDLDHWIQGYSNNDVLGALDSNR